MLLKGVRAAPPSTGAANRVALPWAGRAPQAQQQQDWSAELCPYTLGQVRAGAVPRSVPSPLSLPGQPLLQQRGMMATPPVLLRTLLTQPAAPCLCPSCPQPSWHP